MPIESSQTPTQGSPAQRTICATMVHQEGRGDKGTALMERISTATYDACRSQRLKLEGFPDVQPLLLEMQKTSGAGENSPAIDGSSFKVTVQQPGGALVVKEQFFEQFDDLRFEEQVVGTCAFPMYKPSFHASRKVNQPRRLSTEGQASHTRQPQVSF